MFVNFFLNVFVGNEKRWGTALDEESRDECHSMKF